MECTGPGPFFRTARSGGKIRLIAIENCGF